MKNVLASVATINFSGFCFVRFALRSGTFRGGLESSAAPYVADTALPTAAASPPPGTECVFA